MTDAPEVKAIYCTLVFEFDLKKLQGNPFKTNTPYGLPVAVGIGDSLTKDEERLDLYEALMRLMMQPTMNPISMTPKQREELWSAHAQARAALAKARGES